MPNSKPSLKMTRPRAASLLSGASPFSLRHYQSNICNHSHNIAQRVRQRVAVVMAIPEQGVEGRTKLG